MSDLMNIHRESLREHPIPHGRDLWSIANELCQKALEDARSQMHPLLQTTELSRLRQRTDFLQAFKRALAERIARTLAAWQPGIQAVFQYDETCMGSIEEWDGGIHLLVKVPAVSHMLRAIGRTLDQGLIHYFRQAAWHRFQERQSILEVHQVTARELRHGVGYGAMFCAVYTVPVRVWPPEGAAR